MPNTMADFPAASGAADGNLSAGTENVPPAEKLSWPDPFRRLVYRALRSLAIRALLPVLSKSIHERFNKLDPTRRATVVRVWVILATFLVLALAVPPLLLVYFVGQQVWVMAATLWFYVVFLLFLCVWWKYWNWRQYPEFIHLTYGLLLVFFAAGVIGPPRTAVVVLHLTTAWAAVHLGYSLALDRLCTELVVSALLRGFSGPSRHSKETAEELPQPIAIGWFVVAVLWTALLSATLYGQRMGTALDIIFVLSYMGWIHAALAMACGAAALMHGDLLRVEEEPLPLLLVPCGIASPFIGLLFAVPSGLFQWMLLMALVTFLGYNVTVYLYLRED